MDVNNFLIDEETSLLEAMAKLDQVAKKILFVTREDELVATLTDGDIRRWILKKGDLEAKVKNIANHNPKFLLETERDKANRYMKSHSIDALPLVDEHRNIISVVFLHETGEKKKKTLHSPVVIMAGGLGKRLYPYTKILPKPLIPIGEIPIVEHIINRFHEFGCDQFFLVVNHKKNMIKAYFNDIQKNYILEYADEEIPLGTGGGISLLKGKINSTFFLTNCDILIEEDYEKIYRYHKKENNMITMVCSLKKLQIPYGVVEISKTGEIEAMKEKPELSFFINTGMYLVEPQVIEELEDNQAIGFPDIIEKYQKQGKRIGVFPIGESSWMDMGQIEEMEEMRKRLEEDE